MIGTSIQKHDGIYYISEDQINDNSDKFNETNNSMYLANDPKEAKIMIASSLAFVTGIFQVMKQIIS